MATPSQSLSHYYQNDTEIGRQALEIMLDVLARNLSSAHTKMLINRYSSSTKSASCFDITFQVVGGTV